MASPFTSKFQEHLRSELKLQVRSFEIADKEEILRVGELKLPVDIVLNSEKIKILIEIESHRQDPSNNVAKIFYWIAQQKPEKKILLIQLFSPFYEKHKTKKAVSTWLGKLLEKEYKITYEPVNFYPKKDWKSFEAIYENHKQNMDRIVVFAEKTAEELKNVIDRYLNHKEKIE